MLARFKIWSFKAPGLRCEPRRNQKRREIHVEKNAIPVLVAIVAILVVVWTFFPQTASPPAPVGTTLEKTTN
jgi:hypothetical protein